VTRLRIGLAVAACAVVVHLGALWNGFALDDIPIIVINPLLAKRDAPWTVFASPYWPPLYFPGKLYRPLPMLTYWLDRPIGIAAWFHAVNLVWHAAVSVAVAMLAHRLAGARAALVAGLLFAVHPVHVEAIANVVGRAELMAALFATLSVTAALSGRLGWSIAAFVVAVFCKENAVVTPALVVWAWMAGLGRPNRRRAAAFAVSWVVAGGGYALWRATVLGPYSRYLDLAPVFVGLTPAQGLFTAVSAFTDVARLLLLPLTLRADYSPMERPAVLSLGDLRLWLGAAVFAAWALALIAAYRRGRAVEAFGLGWVAIAFLPVSNLLKHIGVLVAERTLYLPSVGIVLAAAAALTRLRNRRALAVVATLLVAAGALRSATRVPVWRDDLRVALSMLEDSPRSYVGPRYYGAIMQARGHPERALQAYRQAIAIFPHDVAMFMAAADAALTLGQPAVADSFIAYAESGCMDCASLYRRQARAAMDRGDSATAAALLARAPRDTLP